MSRLPMYGKRPCVLLTNDDGPPSAFSPNIYGFARLLQDRLGWDVKVVVPDCQKSWVGKAYAISDVISASYFYPRGPDGMTGDITPVSRPLKDDETMEWVLLSGTPATCANIGLHNLYPGQIDLVISGPNHGRNSSTAFALSSGTIGAALGAALAVPIPGPTSGPSLHADHIPAIALSYGVIKRPVPAIVSQLAHEASAEVCARLWDDWGYEDGTGKRIQLYTINVPLEEEPLRPENRKVCWTRLWRNAYGALFQATKAETTTHDPSDNTSQNNSTAGQSTAAVAGPGAVPTSESPDTPKQDDAESRRLRFKFAPTMGHLLTPRPEDVPEGTDAWGFARGYITVTPLKAEFASIADSARAFGSDEEGAGPCAGRMWKSQSRL